MPSPKVIFYAFWLVTVKALNSYNKNIKTNKSSDAKSLANHQYMCYYTRNAICTAYQSTVQTEQAMEIHGAGPDKGSR